MTQKSPENLSVTIGEAYAGQRVDKALQILFPELSTRARKLLWETWYIFLNERKVSAGAMVREGDVLSAKPQGVLMGVGSESDMDALPQHLEPRLIEEREDWVFFFKPRGLHSVAVRGGLPSLEASLQQKEATYGELFLCNRLDAQTTGIVVAARSQRALAQWQEMENKGLCQKRYVALAQGFCRQTRVKASLDTHKRKITRVLYEEAPLLRQSAFFPLQEISEVEYGALRAYFPEFSEHMPEYLTLMGCTIYKGARHQIRVHAAHAGFPLFNDTRYIMRKATSQECFLLHHGALHYEHGAVYCSAPWEAALQHTHAMTEFFR